jgi:subtilisin family serine protease
MKFNYLIAGALLFLTSCQKRNRVNDIDAGPQKISVAAINATMLQTVQATGSFSWRDADISLVWNALSQSDSILSVGYCLPGQKNIESDLASVSVGDPNWMAAKDKVLSLIYEEESTVRSLNSRNDLIVWEENFLPVVDVKVTSFKTLQKLRMSEYVRYAEPMGFDYSPVVADGKINSDSGCDSNFPDYQLYLYSHYTSVLPNAKASWNYAPHGITEAWDRCSGSGVKVFLIDTGIDPMQENLGSSFNQGYSSGRTIEKIVTLPRNTFLGIPIGPVETPSDQCGHGTMMAGVLSAPRGLDGNAAGVAYNCNLVACRAAANVFIDESREVKGVADAFVNAANRTDVKIISMSMGRISSSSQISDAIKYAYQKGKLIYCAAGTSMTWTAGWVGVIFPASMNEVQAVTGVKEYTNFVACDNCHKGAEVDFVVVMERAADKRHPLTVASFGDTPSTVGGSSVSTATMAGISALLWSRYPSYSREQIVQKLQRYSSLYPIKSSLWGWGTVQINFATL